MLSMNPPAERIRHLLAQLYPPDIAAQTYQRLMTMLEQVPRSTGQREELFSERDVTLITYGDTLREDGRAGLASLHDFLKRRVKGLINTVHILPFYPYSSDDGFSVIDYYQVNPPLGDWQDIYALSQDARLMFDAVINHMSAHSAWFQAFLAGDPAFSDAFVTASPADDLSQVTRPRTSPLLTPFVNADGQTVHVWTTFSADQVDLNYRDPDTLLRIIDVLLFYLRQGGQVLRLDAIAYLWKEPGTTCIHLPQVHTVIHLIRAILDAVAPHVLLITETNVPHQENVAYFGNGYDEAHLVYNFTLPPLLLHTLLVGDARKLSEWIGTLSTPSEMTAFFNFTASHDGIGVRPVEGLLTPDELQHLLTSTEQNGGYISYKENPDGSRSPYELNITYFDALSIPGDSMKTHINRFLLSQAIMLALAGVPVVYIHNLIGSRNNLQGVQETGHNRTINRARLSLAEVEAQLSDADSLRGQIFRRYAQLLNTRIGQRAFHPKGAQRASTLNNGTVLALERSAPDDTEHILALFNVTGQPQTVSIDAAQDVNTDRRFASGLLVLQGYETVWLRR